MRTVKEFKTKIIKAMKRLFETIKNRLRRKPLLAAPVVMHSICLQVGMRVKIKNDTKNYMLNAGRTKVITKQLPDFDKLKAFALDNDEGIWCIEDFEYCVDYPNATMY